MRLPEMLKRPGGDASLPAPRTANFHGRPARGRPEVLARAATERMEARWSTVSRYDRRAHVIDAAVLTPTGTVRLCLQVTDERPFAFEPGNFVGIECHVEGLGYRRSPYCILSPPGDDGRFELLVRVVPGGPLSRYLATLRPGDEVAFRGPTGRSMSPKDPELDLVLVATGVGVGPFYSLAAHLLRRGFDRTIDLFWGLRLAEDICLTDELDRLASEYPNFSYRISLSRPPADWSGLRGRVSESMPPLLGQLGDKQFQLCGNGAMIEELAAALSDVGVARHVVHKEPYFNGQHQADPAVVAAIRDRFVADDVFCARPSWRRRSSTSTPRWGHAS